jgi:DNA-binding NarL/FixJ family response regulator
VNRHTLLLVDDHAMFRSHARALLELGGFVVVGEAATGEDALDAARALQPDVMLLDVVLPDIDGFTVCARVAEQAAPPIVVLTSSRAASMYRQRLLGCSARGFIAKSDLTAPCLAALVDASV